MDGAPNRPTTEADWADLGDAGRLDGSCHATDRGHGGRLLAQHVEAPHRLLLALERARIDLLDLEAVAHESERRLADDDLPGSAIEQRRALVFAVSPMTVYESAFELPTYPTTQGPVWMPMPIGERAASPRRYAGG